MAKNLRTLFINLPHRDVPDNFPPYGAMAVITALQRAGHRDTSFYNMDVMRPSRNEALDYITSFKPDVLAISSPVSTGYEGSKFFSLEIKKRLPGITVILGGNLAASAEIILSRTGVDFCVLGEGEKACCQLFEKYFPHNSKKALYDVKGLAFLDGGALVITGYAEQLPKEAIFDVDWDILDTNSVKHYFPRLGDLDENSSSFRYFSPHDHNNPSSVPFEAVDKTIGVISCSKGCFNHCTYCHRFVHGARFIPPEIVINRIRELITRFNVGAIAFADECFGANRQWLREFCELIKPLDLLWKVGGMRVDMVTPELLARMKDAGCRTIIYGMESGSERILKVMEKRVTLKENFDAAKWTIDAGLHTTVQLVVGMPGETPETIEETAHYVYDVMTLNNSQNPGAISINFAQALPGTPLYEYGRRTGSIGQTLEEEEQYLLRISDRNASDSSTTLNFTGYPRLILLSWPMLIRCHVNYMYVQRFGLNHYYNMIFKSNKPPSLLDFMRTKKLGLLLDRYPLAVYKLRIFMWLVSLLQLIRKEGVARSLKLLKEFLFFYLKNPPKKRRFLWEYKSLRRILEEDRDQSYLGSKEMVLLRRGR
jgi:anaerobic magnesium-protoporphyrin IX monomethyl ester cyclase